MKFPTLVVVASLLLMATLSSAQTVCFNEVDTATGANPLRAVLLDSNKDGKVDFALLRSFGLNDTNSALGNGDGTFTKVKTYKGPRNPTSITSGDFNNDGNLDLAISFNSPLTNTGIVGILLGNGDGTFGNAHTVTTLHPADTIAAGDFNRDGNLDVAITTGVFASSPDDIELLLGNGDGTLQPATVVASLPWYTTVLSVTDLNADGKLDLVSDGGDTNGNGEVLTVLLGNGNGTFQTPATYHQSLGGGQIAVADMNGDGKIDVVVPGGPGFLIYYGTGTGTLTGPSSVSVAASPLSVVALDIFGNGLLDLVGSDSSGSSRIAIAVNNGDGTFTSQTYNVLSTNYYVYAADFNNDGKTDVLVLYIDHFGLGV